MNIYTYLRIKQAGIWDNIKNKANDLAGKANEAFNDKVKPAVENAANKANEVYQENIQPTVSNAASKANEFYQENMEPTVSNALNAAGDAVAAGRKWAVELTPEYKALQNKLQRRDRLIQKGLAKYQDFKQQQDEYEQQKADWQQQLDAAINAKNEANNQFNGYVDDVDSLINDMHAAAAAGKAEKIKNDIYKNMFTGGLVGGVAGELGRWGLRKAYGPTYFRDMALNRKNKWYKRGLGNVVENLGVLGAGAGAVGANIYSYNKYNKLKHQLDDARDAIVQKYDGFNRQLTPQERLQLQRDVFDAYKDI